MRLSRLTLITVLLFLWSLPAWAYIIVLKDGTQVNAKEKYRRDGDRVLVVLVNGTLTEMSADEVDFAKTEELNTSGSRSDIVIGDTQIIEEAAPPPPPPIRAGDLSRTRLSLPQPPPTSPAAADAGPQLPLTSAGFVDLKALPREEYANVEILAELKQFLESQGVEGFEVFNGSAADRPMLLVETASESVVFDVLKHAAGALVQTNARFPEQMAALELLMLDDRQQRAGQFVLTPDLVRPLTTGRLPPEVFFVRHVQF